MATTKLQLPTIDELRDRYVADVKRLKIRAGVPSPNVAPGSETYCKGQALAGALQMIMAREVALQDAQMGDSATGDDIVRLCELEGINVSLGEGAVGYVVASCTTGTVYPTGAEWKSSDGLRYGVVTTTIADDGDLVPIKGIDVGKRTCKPAGNVGKWSSPPIGSELNAEVGPDGLKFGMDADTPATLQAKWIYAKRHPARGGNWAHVAQDAENSSSAIQRAFVYPGVYGPSTMHAAIVVEADAANAYSRVASPILQLGAAQAVVSKHPDHADVSLTSVVDWDIDVIIKVVLSEPKSVGGIGGGWLDASAQRWPYSLNATTPYAVRLNAAPLNPRTLQVISDTPPIVGAHFAVWSTLQKKFLHGQVASVSGVASPYTITLYSSIGDVTALASGDWIVADAEQLDQYATAIAESFGALGPGEKTASAARLPRSFRKPLVMECYPNVITSKTFDAFSTAFSSIYHCEFYRAFDATPTTYTTPIISTPVNATVGGAPYILRLGKLAIYGV